MLLEARAPSALDSLSPREEAIAAAFGEGRSYKQIAASLGYAVESTGDLGQARSQMRGRSSDILLVNLPA